MVSTVFLKSIMQPCVYLVYSCIYKLSNLIFLKASNQNTFNLYCLKMASPHLKSMESLYISDGMVAAWNIYHKKRLASSQTKTKICYVTFAELCIRLRQRQENMLNWFWLPLVYKIRYMIISQIPVTNSVCYTSLTASESKV